jgi:hypothetical protein
MYLLNDIFERVFSSLASPLLHTVLTSFLVSEGDQVGIYLLVLINIILMAIPDLSLAARYTVNDNSIYKRGRERRVERAQVRAERLKKRLGAGSQIGEVNYSGIGCPDGSIATVISPDKKTVSVLFDSFEIERSAKIVGTFSSDDTLDERNAVKSMCQLQLPLQVPRGVQARITNVDLRGYLSLPAKSHAGISGHARFASAGYLPELSTKYQFKGPMDDDFLVQTKYPSETGSDWTVCGTDDVMLITTRIHVINNNKEEDAMMTVDTADVESDDTTMKVLMELRPCRKNRL